MLDVGDLRDIYDACGVEVTHIAKATAVHTSALRGVFSSPSLERFEGEVSAADPQVRYPVPLWPLVRRGDRLILTGTTYIVREGPHPLHGGEEAVVHLELP